MKLRYRIRMAVFSLVKQMKVSLLVLLICFLSCYMLGNTLNEYFNEISWNGKATELLGRGADELYYLDYTRFSSDIQLESSFYEEMYQKIRDLDGISWFGAYQSNVYWFEENTDNEEYVEFIKKVYPDCYESYDSGTTPAVYLYGDGWELGNLEMIDGEAIKGTLDSGEIPLYVGSELAEYFQVGNVYHQHGGTFRVVGVLKPESTFLVPGGLGGICGKIELDRYVVSGIHSDLFAGVGLYINFGKNVYIKFAKDVDKEDTVHQILNILQEYGYHGWCRSVESMEQERAEGIESEVREKLELLVLLLVLHISIMLVVSGIRIMARKKMYGVWYANGFDDGNIVWCMFWEQGFLVTAAVCLAAGILAGEVLRYLEIQNRPLEIYTVMDECFWYQTMPILVIFALVSIVLPVIFSVLLFKRFSIVEMMKDVEKE